MDKTNKLKNIILSRYGSIREFSKIVKIPSTTLTSALDKGIGGMAVDRVILICDVLNLDIKTFDTLENNHHNFQSKNESLLMNNYQMLNITGKAKLIEYSNDLIENKKYIKESSFMPNTLAAHDDDLTEEEKDIALSKALYEFKKMDNK